MISLSRYFATGALWLGALLCPLLAEGAPGDVLFSDDFNDGNLAPWTSSNGGRAGVANGGQVSNSAPSGAFTRRGFVNVTSPGINAAVPAARVQLWVRRGDDNFSENPDSNEDFVVQYRRADGTFGTLISFAGQETPGQVYTPDLVLPADALHGNLAIRVQQTAGSGGNFDFWHFDDVIVTEIAPALPLVVGSCDDFEGDGSNWTFSAVSGVGGIGSATSLSPTHSLFLNGGVVSATSGVIDTSGPQFSDLTLWVRRGSDTFSEFPDGGENLIVEYLDDTNAWVGIETFTGGGAAGQQFFRTYTLPAAARHAGFQLRFRQNFGSGIPWDFWHVDDVCFVEIPFPTLLVTKISQTIWDPVNLTNSPLAIPGAEVNYTISVTNQGTGPVDSNSLTITDPVPLNTALYIDTSGGDPIVFAQGAIPSGLTGAVLSYSDDGGSTFTYTPQDPDGDGYDPAVTNFQVDLQGTMSGASGGNNPSFTVTFRVRID